MEIAISTDTILTVLMNTAIVYLIIAVHVAVFVSFFTGPQGRSPSAKESAMIGLKWIIFLITILFRRR